MLLASCTFDTLLNRFRFFDAENLMSLSQRAAKLLAIKLRECLTLGKLESGPTGSRGQGSCGRLFLETSNFEASNFEDL